MVQVHALLATGVNRDGHREILGLEVTTAEDGAGWLAFFRGLLARGLAAVKLVTSDAHTGLLAAVGARGRGVSETVALRDAWRYLPPPSFPL